MSKISIAKGLDTSKSGSKNNTSASKIHGINVVSSVINIITNEGKVQFRKICSFCLQLLFERSSGNDKILDAFCAEHTQLTMENGFPIFKTRHRFMILLGKFFHTVAKTGVKNYNFHYKYLPFKISQ